MDRQTLANVMRVLELLGIASADGNDWVIDKARLESFVGQRKGYRAADNILDWWEDGR